MSHSFMSTACVATVSSSGLLDVKKEQNEQNVKLYHNYNEKYVN